MTDLPAWLPPALAYIPQWLGYQAGAFASFGEPARLVHGPDGAVAEVHIAGNRSVSEAALAAELVARYER